MLRYAICNHSAILAKVADRRLKEANSACCRHFELEFYHLTFARVNSPEVLPLFYQRDAWRANLQIATVEYYTGGEEAGEMSQLSGDLVRYNLKTDIMGQNVLYTQQTGSTNTELKKLARANAPEGLLFLTNEQLAGRGRMDRSWHAPPGSSLLLSLLFRPGEFVKPAQSQYLTMLCALAMAEAIEAKTQLSVGLKWPNDLVWKDNKKLAGILTESEIEGDRLSWVIVGMGLNVNVDFSLQTGPIPDRPGKPGSGQPPLAKTATSLSMILERDTSDLRLPLLQCFLENVEKRYDALRVGQSPRDEWQHRLTGLGQTVTVTNMSEAHQVTGIISGVDENGALRLKQANGSIVTILAGDVTLR